ncbi:dephospho-CoA kinase [Orbaceae bacterium ESL0727]|nr:dephospho-CoA kinase [Orbaceae bacterium ESL0727]
MNNMLQYWPLLLVDSGCVMPYIVALSGGIASGKTTVANLFAQLGVPIIDADVIARQVVAPGTLALAEIVRHFSQEILLANGQLDRSQLRELIFHNDHERLWLNHLLHPLIQQETTKAIAAQHNAPYLLWVIPLLVENNLMHFANSILVIDVSPEQQLERLILRDHIDADLATKMVLSQTSNQKRLACADQIIKNEGDLADLAAQVDRLHHYYLALARSAAEREPQ